MFYELARVLPSRVATVLTFTAVKPLDPDTGECDLIASPEMRNKEAAASVLPHRSEQLRRAEVSEHGTPYRYDAGDLGCGDGLPRELRRHIGEIPAGATIEVTVRDPAAKADLPPLVRMLGHRVLSEETHPDGRLVFEVERKHE